MKYLFDSSAIYNALGPDVIGKLVGNYTLDLAKYEIGNIVWKEGALHKRMTGSEQEKIMRLAVDALDSMTILGVNGHEGRILALANKYKLSFYDSSYAYFARAMNIPLVTTDKKLVNQIAGYAESKDVQSI